MCTISGSLESRFVAAGYAEVVDIELPNERRDDHRRRRAYVSDATLASRIPVRQKVSLTAARLPEDAYANTYPPSSIYSKHHSPEVDRHSTS